MKMKPVGCKKREGNYKKSRYICKQPVPVDRCEYEVSDHSATWHDAKEICQSKGMELASIDS